MFLMISRSARQRDRKRGKRLRAKLAAKHRRRVNRQARRRMSAAGHPNKH
jgi:hypothetical protein